MPDLIVCDRDGKTVLRRPLEADEHTRYYAARMSGALVSFEGRRYRLHSVARTRPTQDCILCVTFDSLEVSLIDCE